jgi:type I restriction enzyme S subunit
MNKVKLGDIITIYNGKAHQSLEEVGNFPVFGSGGLMGYTHNFMYEGEAILLPRKGTLSNIQYLNKKFGVVDTTYYAVVDKEKANTYYVWNYLKILNLENLNSGSAVPSMTQKAYQDIEVLLPDLSTQSVITRVLSSLDDKIELNNKINKELENLARTIYEYWFVQFDFPNAEEKPYKSNGGKMVYNEEINRNIPEGWDVKNLNSVVSNISDSTQSGEHLNKMFYTPLDEIPMRKMSFWGGLSYNEAKSSLQLYKEDDILLGAMRVYFHRVCIAVQNGITRSTTMVLRANKKEYVPFIYELINMDSTIAYATKQSAKSQQPYVNWENELAEYKFAFPSNIDIIDKYSKITMPFIKQVKINEKENYELKQLRDFLLPLLMNGQVTVGKAQKEPTIIPFKKFTNEEAKYQTWKTEIGLAARGGVDEQTLRKIYEAIDENDR